jgi:predicted DNA-binding transcriptional regulator AlpA
MKGPSMALAATPESLTGQELLDARQAAAVLHAQVQTLAKWRCQGGGPHFIRLSRRMIRYRRSDLDAFIAARTRTHTTADTSEPAA